MKLDSILWAAALLTPLALGSVCQRAMGHQVDTTFTVSTAQSPLTIAASATFIFPFSDMDTHNLEGTINATFGFGRSGLFPNLIDLNVTSSAITHEETYVLNLGPERADIDGIVASVATINPPAPLTRNVALPGLGYQFDASEALITLVAGTVELSGFVTDTYDLAEQDPPVSGSAPAGTLGNITFSLAGTSGFYSRVNATMQFPVDIEDTITVQGTDVDIELTGTVVATSQFYVALSGVPGDFDDDGDVDGADLPRWRAGFGDASGAGPGDGDANRDGDVDGDDFLVWQRNLGTAPPPLGVAAAGAVPEPTSWALGALAATMAAGLRRRA